MSEPSNVPGTSLSAEQLGALGYNADLPPSVSKSADLLARKYLDSHQERPMDPRLKSGSPAVHRADAIRAALRESGIASAPTVALANAVNRLSHADVDVNEAVIQLRAQYPQWWDAPVARSSDTLAHKIVAALRDGAA